MSLTAVGNTPCLALRLGSSWAGSVLLLCPRDTTSHPHPGHGTCLCPGQNCLSLLEGPCSLALAWGHLGAWHGTWGDPWAATEVLGTLRL